eukprot:scaffold1120_cov127-Cylindrotheca_fusiformis.AAC.5
MKSRGAHAKLSDARAELVERFASISAFFKEKICSKRINRRKALRFHPKGGGDGFETPDLGTSKGRSHFVEDNG